MNYLIDDYISAKDFSEYMSEEKLAVLSKGTNYVKLSDGNTYEFDKRYNHILKKLKEPEQVKNDPIIFGTDPTENIVAIEVNENDEVEIYLADGNVITKEFRPWVLTTKPTKGSIRLDGDQHYKYINYFNSKKYMSIFVQKCKKNNVDYYTSWNDAESVMLHEGYTQFKGMKITDIPVLAFDIESTGLVKDENSKVFLITNTFRDSKGTITKKHFRVDHYDDDDVAMIEDWCKWVVQIDPSVMTGHYINVYDIPFLQFCYSERQGENQKLPLGKFHKPIKVSNKPSDKRVDGGQSWSYHKTQIYGRHIVDGVFLCIPYDIGKKYKTWGLKTIAEHEGWVSPDRQFYDAAKIKDDWHDPKKRELIIQYGIDDSDDSIRVFDLMGVAPFYMCHSVPKSFQVITESASGAMLNAIMVRAYLQDNHSIPKTDEPTYVGGGISFGIPGVHSNVFKIDVKSMYPSIIREFKLSPKKKDPKGYYHQITDYFTIKRFEQKAKFKETGDTYYDDLQATSKVFINSLYGLTSTPGLHFNDFTVANIITATSRQIIKDTIKWSTGSDIYEWFPEYKLGDMDNQYAEKVSNGELKYSYQMVNCDTDSISFKKQNNEKYTDKELQDILDQVNTIFPEMIEYEDDGYYDKVAVIKAKNYCMLKGDKLSIKGSGFKDSKKEPILRQMMIDIVNAVMYENKDYVDIYEDYIKLAKNITDIEPWCTKVSISEKLVEADSTIKNKKLDALDDREFQLGDKFYMFQDIDGERQDVKKGELVYKRIPAKEAKALGIVKQPKSEDCDHSDRSICMLCNPNMMVPKMIPNDIYRCKRDFTGSYDKKHYLFRVYKTAKILESIIDFTLITDYSKLVQGD